MSGHKMVILGANSQIGRSLLEYFADDDGLSLVLFTHRPGLLSQHLESHPLAKTRLEICSDFAQLSTLKYELLLNCIGAGSPGKMQGNHGLWYDITEKFDIMALEALQQSSPQALYVSFSSGAVYGRNRNRPCQAGDRTDFPVNSLPPPDYYSLMRMNAEARHRSKRDLRIADLRIFSFFSRYSGTDDGYLLSDILRALLTRQPLQVSPVSTIRDYIHPGDLARLIRVCAEKPAINIALDVCSRAPVEKFTLLKVLENKFGLRFEIREQEEQRLNGSCDVYCSEYNKAADLGFQPQFSALETLLSEIPAALENQRGLQSFPGQS